MKFKLTLEREAKDGKKVLTIESDNMSLDEIQKHLSDWWKEKGFGESGKDSDREYWEELLKLFRKMGGN